MRHQCSRFVTLVLGASLVCCSAAVPAAPAGGAIPCGDLPPPMAAFGMPHRPGGGGGFFEPMPPYLHGLRLDEAQRDKVFAVLHAQVPLLREQAKALHQAEAELRTLSWSAAFDEARARTLAAAGARAMAELTLLRARSDSQILALLTPEQRRLVEEGPGRTSPPGAPGRPTPGDAAGWR